MNLRQFINEYGNHIRMYKEYDNGVIMFKLEKPEKWLWFKRMVHENLNMRVKTGSAGGPYWFEPIA